MIFIMSMKDWKKNKKKLVVAKKYVIFDGTEDDDAYMSKFTNTVTMDAFNPPIKLVKLIADKSYDEIIDIDKIEALEEKFLNGPSLTNAIMATVAGVVEESDVNIFIVMRNKAFKTYGNKIKKRFKKLINVDFPFVKVISGDISDYKRDLRSDFSNSEMKELSKALSKREKSLRETFNKKKKSGKSRHRW